MCERWHEPAWFVAWLGSNQGYVEGLHNGVNL